MLFDSLEEKFVAVFTQANAHMKAGEYSAAVNLYASILGVNADLDGHLRFNLALAVNLLVNPHKLPPITVNNAGVGLAPLNDVEIDSSVSDTWVSTGDDPHFNLRISHANLRSGWYAIGLLIGCLRRRNSARFYLDYGEGYTEDSAFSVSYTRNILTTRVVYIKPGLRSVRFDPLAYQDRFDVKVLHWEPISEERALETMIQDINSREPKGLDTEGVGVSCLSKLEITFQKYSRLVDSINEVSSYKDWIENVESKSLPGHYQISQMKKRFAKQPLISILVPVYNTCEAHLRECLDSVLGQSYENWELCVADDASTNPRVTSVLDEYQRRDTRVKVFYRNKNGHISRASNSALTLATGDFVALLDHDDTLSKDALLFVVDALNKVPDALIIYSDEDKLDSDGERIEPHFKSDWNQELLYSQNYVSHLGVYKKTLLDMVGGFRVGYEGSQDYDLLLRCIRHAAHNQIVHVPRVLYHWRALEGSTALSSDQKSYTSDAGLKALKYHFAKTNAAVRVTIGPAPNTYRVRWQLPKKLPLVSLIIPTRDRRALTEVAVRSILTKTTYKNYEILILDNGSTEQDALDFFDSIQIEDSRVRVIRYDYPFNYSAINNFGVSHAKGSIIGLVNNDIEIITPDWLKEMVSYSLRPDVGCVGAKLYYSNDTVQHAGVICSLGGVAGHSHKHFPRTHPGYFYRLMLTQNLSAVTAACMIVRKEVFEAVGGLDEVNLKVAFNDVDFCLKVRSAGFNNVWTPYAELYHYESISRGAEDSPEKITRFRSEIEFMKTKWTHHLEKDVFYNINLTQDREDFSLRLH